MTIHTWLSPYGRLRLRRYPSRKRETLLPWCSADQLLLELACAEGIAGQQVLVVNDAHGALSLALQPLALWTDSALSAYGMRENAALNQLPLPPIVWSTQAPPIADVVILRIPKQLAYLEFQLSRLASILPEGARLYAAGMDKHLSPRTAELFEQHIGPTQRHPGRKKARLFAATRSLQLKAPDPENMISYYCDEVGGELRGLPNVFSRERLDIGARLLLSQLGTLEPVEKLADLACGNGVLGLSALHAGLSRNITFVDESAQAVAATRDNALRLFPQAIDQLSFVHGDGFAPISDQQFDLVLCNPPFHLEQTVDHFVGSRLIRQCARALNPAGKLLLVANRHLDYSAELSEGFKRLNQITQTSKFKLFLAHK